MRIDFVSDVACPWCAVGLASLERALAAIGEDFAVELHFQPFELNPDMGPEGADAADYLKAKYGMSDAQRAAAREGLRERGAAVGFVFGERSRVWNTFDAHRLLAFAAGSGRQQALKRALLEAYHGQGRNPGSHEVLLELAAQVGLDPVQARRVLQGDDHAAEVRAAEAELQRAGIHAVPSVIVDGRHLIQGGQPPEVYERALRQIAALPAH
jgi:predicted DsbA family dithiol-disulfide isomerase